MGRNVGVRLVGGPLDGQIMRLFFLGDDMPAWVAVRDPQRDQHHIFQLGDQGKSAIPLYQFRRSLAAPNFYKPLHSFWRIFPFIPDPSQGPRLGPLGLGLDPGPDQNPNSASS